MIITAVDGGTTRALRQAVLRPELTLADHLPGDELPDAVHVAAVEADGTVVATCFGYPEPCAWRPGEPAWRLRQMATAPERRGEGWGARITEELACLAMADGANILWCHAREYAVPFYERCGFVPHGEGFTEHDLPHRRMWRRLG